MAHDARSLAGDWCRHVGGGCCGRGAVTMKHNCTPEVPVRAHLEIAPPPGAATGARRAVPPASPRNPTQGSVMKVANQVLSAAAAAELTAEDVLYSRKQAAQYLN